MDLPDSQFPVAPAQSPIPLRKEYKLQFNPLQCGFAFKSRHVPAGFWNWINRSDSPYRGRILVGDFLWYSSNLWVFILFAFAIPSARPLTSALLMGLQTSFIVTGLVLVYRTAKKAWRDFLEWQDACDFQLCFDCGYPLEGLPSPHRCPECSAEYDRETPKRRWIDWLETGKVRPVAQILANNESTQPA